MSIYRKVKAFFFEPPKPEHIWKTEKMENLGSYMHHHGYLGGPDRMYRIAVHQKCLLTGETRIQERHDFFPVEESP